MGTGGPRPNGRDAGVSAGVNPLRAALAVGLVGLLLGVGAVLLVVRAAPTACCRGAYVELFDRRMTGVEAVLGRGDGQAFDALARDPLLARPHAFLAADEEAYRAQRPLLGYLAWAGSLGSPDRVPWTIAVLEMLGCGFAAGAVALLLATRRASPWFALAVIPAAMAALNGLTPEVLALGLAAAGVVAWERRRPWAAAGWLVAAVLTRETMLVVPTVLAIEWLVASRGNAGDARRRVAGVAPLVVPFAVFAGWIAVVRLRLGAFPTAASHRRLGLPLAGLLDAARHWGAADATWAVLAAVLVALAWVTAPRDRLTWIATAYAGFALFLGPDVWARWEDFTRVLLPLYAFAAVATFATVTRSATLTTSSALGAARRAARAPFAAPRDTRSATLTTSSALGAARRAARAPFAAPRDTRSATLTSRSATLTSSSASSWSSAAAWSAPSSAVPADPA
ncbi:MAG TPA: hypothetical protein VFC99_19325 [Acidimicrobiia bacterium]|nr:hypothetical protein [Acidimicrobiia bacterium]